MKKTLTALPDLSLVVGGAASGKSAFAEKLVLGAGLATAPIYLASAQGFDDEMRTKIARHREIRAEDGWQTLEEPLHVASVLAARAPNETVLFDCATLWLTNQVMADADLDQAVDDLLAALAQASAKVVIVTNEIGQGVVPDHAMSRRFREAHGKMNQRLAAQADLVVQVVVGLPHVLKGAM